MGVAEVRNSRLSKHMQSNGGQVRHIERHRTARVGWLRAAVLGANDGLISTASLVVGVAASGAPRPAVLIAGVAGLVLVAWSTLAGGCAKTQARVVSVEPPPPLEVPAPPPRIVVPTDPTPVEPPD